MKKVISLRQIYALKSRFQRLRERGMLTGDEVAQQLGVSTTTVHQMGRAEVLKRQLYGNNYRCLYEPLGVVQFIKGVRSGPGILNSAISGNSWHKAWPKTAGQKGVFDGQEISATHPAIATYYRSTVTMRCNMTLTPCPAAWLGVPATRPGCSAARVLRAIGGWWTRSGPGGP